MPRPEGKRIELASREIPRTKAGDPNFQSLKEALTIFQEWEVVNLLNDAIYNQEYQRTYHRNREAKIRELEAPVKAAAKRMFPGVSWLKLTPEQVRKAWAEAEREKGR